LVDRAVFLDRDGVICEDTDYLYRTEDLKFIKGSIDAISKLSKTYFKIIIIASQSGIGRGYYTEEIFHKVMKFMIEEIRKNGGRIDAYYFCPHHSTEGKGKYRIECKCRKPKIGMLEDAAREFNLDLKECYVIGDKTDDVKMGENAGCKTILVKTGKGGLDGHFDIKPDHVAKDLNEAIKHITEEEYG